MRSGASIDLWAARVADRILSKYVDSLTEKPPAPLLSEQIEALPIGTTFVLNYGGTADQQSRMRVVGGYINSFFPETVHPFVIWDHDKNVTLGP